MSATCEICGKEFKNTQGLRGHKTFVHGIHADKGKQANGFQCDQQEDRTTRDNRIKDTYMDKYQEKLDKLENDLRNNTELVNKLRSTVNKLQEQLLLMVVPFREIHNISRKVDSLCYEVKKHEKWLNPRGIHDAIMNLSDGPIADIETQLRHRRPAINPRPEENKYKP